MNKGVALTYDFGSEEVIFIGVPLGFSGGFIHGVRFAIFLGATLVLQESWDSDRALQIMAREKATYTMITPTLLYDLLRSKLFTEYSSSLSLKVILCGGALVSTDLLRLAQDTLPATLTSALWGMTEGIGTACTFNTSNDYVIGTDGQPFPGTELKILKEDSSEAEAGEIGDLVIRGPQLFLGYFNRPDMDEEVFLHGGWFRTGDLALINTDGYLKITGRRKSLIIRGGINISPEEVEEQLRGDARIKQIAVVDIPDERLGERACACVVLNSAKDELRLEDLTEIARQQGIAKHKWPERLQIMDSLPQTSSGKLQREELRKYIRRIIEDERSEENTNANP